MHRLIGRLRDVLDRVVEMRHDNHDAIIAAEHDDFEEAEQFWETLERRLLATRYSLEDTIRDWTISRKIPMESQAVQEMAARTKPTNRKMQR